MADHAIDRMKITADGFRVRDCFEVLLFFCLFFGRRLRRSVFYGRSALERWLCYTVIVVLELLGDGLWDFFYRTELMILLLFILELVFLCKIGNDNHISFTRRWIYQKELSQVSNPLLRIPNVRQSCVRKNCYYLRELNRNPLSDIAGRAVYV